jgi:steroid 5-alpha reductase family enzyme
VIFPLGALGCAIAAIVMALVWAWHRTLGNARVAEAGWALLVGGLATFYAVLGHGAVQRRMAIGFMMGSWGARLAVHILYDRVYGQEETGRYAGLRRSWSGSAASRYFWLFETYAAAAVFFSLPALFPSVNPDPELSIVELAAAVLWMVAFTGETTADRQLTRFKANPERVGLACRDGLWRYARHPSSVFEWLIWVAYAAFASASPYGWLAVACPVVMAFRLFRMSRIRPQVPLGDFGVVFLR